MQANETSSKGNQQPNKEDKYIVNLSLQFGLPPATSCRSFRMTYSTFGTDGGGDGVGVGDAAFAAASAASRTQHQPQQQIYRRHRRSWDLATTLCHGSYPVLSCGGSGGSSTTSSGFDNEFGGSDNELGRRGSRTTTRTIGRMRNKISMGVGIPLSVSSRRINESFILPIKLLNIAKVVLCGTVLLILSSSSSSSFIDTHYCQAWKPASVSSSRMQIDQHSLYSRRSRSSLKNGEMIRIPRGGSLDESASSSTDGSGTTEEDTKQTPATADQESENENEVVDEEDDPASDVVEVVDTKDSNKEDKEEEEEVVVATQTTIEQEEEEEESEALDMDDAIEKATELRLRGKHLHDESQFQTAAVLFHEAAETILTSYRYSYQQSQQDNELDVGDGTSDDESSSDTTKTRSTVLPPPLPEDYATCRLHEALCYLKSDDNDKCIIACNDVLQDENNDNDDDVDDGDDDEEETSRTSTSTAVIIKTANPLAYKFSPAVRARAYHRRAKAKVATGDMTGAVLDARTGAFLGYDKAVAMYGKLMRESSSLSSSLSSQDESISDALINPLFQPQSSSTSDLLQSLLSKSTAADGSSGSPSSPFGSMGNDFNPLSMLMGSTGDGGAGAGAAAGLVGALTGAGKGGGSGGGGFVGSMVQNLSKRLDDKDTQESISNFLQRTNKQQLSTFVGMTPIKDSIDEKQLDRVVEFCHGVTPQKIRWTVRITKIVTYIVKFFRRLFKLLGKYKSLIAAALIFQWAKSATFRPFPVNPKAGK